MSYEALVLDDNTLAHEGAAGYLAACPDRRSALHLDERTYRGLITDRATLEVDEGRDRDVFTMWDVIRDDLMAGEDSLRELVM